MVILYGVNHGAQEVGMFGGSKELPFSPSREFLEDLATFPAKTTVALEWWPEEEKEKVHGHLAALYQETGLLGTARYSDYTELYWKKIIDVCKKQRHTIAFLEDQSIWFRYNQAAMEAARREQRLARNIEEGRIDEERMDLKEWYHHLLLARKIHEIERDDSFLQKIQSAQVAIVGKGHSDYWVHYKKIMPELYSTDTARIFASGQAKAIFTANAIPNPRAAYGQVSLERTLHFMETGRIYDQTADYVGTWDMSNPWHGYFELFIQRQSKQQFSGIIEDCVGSATFEGWLRPNGLDFVKRYQESTEDALQRPIYYYAEGGKSELAGRYSTRIGGLHFCMVKKSQEDPQKLVLLWEKLNRARNTKSQRV